MPAAARSSGRRPARSTPSSVMRTARAGSNPMMLLRKVVLPTPFLPIRQTTLPVSTWRETSHRIWLSPYATSRPSTSSIRISAPAQVDFHHAFVLLHLHHRALAEHLALMQHGDFSSDVAHELHVVLDDQHRALLRHRLQQATRLFRLLVGHARHRLVHEQELGVLNEHHSYLEPLLLAVTQATRSRL